MHHRGQRFFTAYAAVLLTFVIEFLAVMAERSSARSRPAVVVLDVVTLGALRVIVMHGFTGANGMPWSSFHGGSFRLFLEPS
jgi:hypothetical protein